MKNNNRLRKSPELKTVENRNTVSGFYKVQKGFLITVKLGKIAVRQTQCFLLPEVFAFLLVLLTAFKTYR